MNRTTDRKNIYKEITDKIIDSLQAGVIPWVRPWDAVKYGEHRNGVTNRPYRGLNVMLLNLVAMMKGFADPRWLTYRNAAKLGGHVRKGESGVSILFWKFVAEKERDEEEDRLIPIARMYTVFNVEQCQGLDLPELTAKDCNEESANQAAEKILSLAKIVHGGGRAYYAKDRDVIVMPRREAFLNLNFYYSTGYHETLHWSGHPERLNRCFGKRFGDQAYAFEELVAEIGSAFLGAGTAIPFEEMRHPEYINSWLEVLKNDHKAIFTAAAQAQAAADYLFAAAGLTVTEEEELPQAA
jgi:antirestriction protein ArdC